jgi:aminocarboxymuconate-semialdehyde decarboxylase
MILGSDYPFPLGEAVPGKLVIGYDGLTRAQKNEILWRNGLEFLGLKQEQFVDSAYPDNATAAADEAAAKKAKTSSDLTTD